MIVDERLLRRTAVLRFVAGRLHHQCLIANRRVIDRGGENSVVSAEELVIAGPCPSGGAFRRPADGVAPRIVVADAAESFERVLLHRQPISGVAAVRVAVAAIFVKRRRGRHSFRSRIESLRDHRSGDMRRVLLIASAVAIRVAGRATLEVNREPAAEFRMGRVGRCELEEREHDIFSAEVVRRGLHIAHMRHHRGSRVVTHRAMWHAAVNHHDVFISGELLQRSRRNVRRERMHRTEIDGERLIDCAADRVDRAQRIINRRVIVKDDLHARERSLRRGAIRRSLKFVFDAERLHRDDARIAAVECGIVRDADQVSSAG